MLKLPGNRAVNPDGIGISSSSLYSTSPRTWDPRRGSFFRMGRAQAAVGRCAVGGSVTDSSGSSMFHSTAEIPSRSRRARLAAFRAS